MKTKDKDSVEIQLTTDGERYYSFAGHGNTEDTSKTKKLRANVRWFKNEKKLYVIRQDERKVKDLFVIDVLAQPRPKLESYRYSLPGEEFVPQEELVIFDVETRGRVNVDVKKWKDQTINVEWTSQEAADKLILGRTDSKTSMSALSMQKMSLTVLFSEETWPYLTMNTRTFSFERR
jgi:hypothetical protein